MEKRKKFMAIFKSKADPLNEDGRITRLFSYYPSDPGMNIILVWVEAEDEKLVEPLVRVDFPDFLDLKWMEIKNP